MKKAGTAKQGRLPLDKPFLNRGLFADHFLEYRLSDLDEWKAADGLDDAFQAVLKLYRESAAEFTDDTNEPQTEHDFIQPVLDLLWRERRAGDCYRVQVVIPNLDGHRQPDYAFFRSTKDRSAAQKRLGRIEYFRDVPCLGDAKKWSASLDKKRGADENPSAQIANYLYRSRVRWGILTNGRIWRLYEREKSSAGGIFLEVNLEDILENGDLEAFRYLYLFFRREAFLPDAAGITFLERVFEGSLEYATKVGGRLKESVYDALRLLMNGFYEHSGNGLDRDDQDTLKAVHENSLIALYRLLFVLYAEDRGLLPLDHEVYRDHSLRRLHREINGNLRAGRTYLPAERRFWGELAGLFELIDNGLPHKGKFIIPAYNGGLFNPSKYPAVAHTPLADVRRWEVGDHRLAEVIDMLAYERERWDEAGTRDIDYGTLGVQHLGSIYEGLLELRPRVADEALVETLEKGKAVFKPEREVSKPRVVRGQQPRRIAKGEVYLITDRGERKATGSYYTPKYIVDYIVENTVGPLADRAAQQVAKLLPDVKADVAKVQRTRRKWEQEAKKGNKAEAEQHIADLEELIDGQERRLLDPYLSLNILDPAMGSGHFLVGAADLLSMAMATDPGLPDLTEVGDEDPQAFFKRLIVERCLYGVDLNPLAVELAKLSLWLHTVSKNKALSFLDHHLRCGNSLIGARIEEDLMKGPPQFDPRGRRTNADNKQLVLGFYETLTGTHLKSFLDTFRQIVETPTGDAETERMKDKWYREMDAVRDKFRAAANCWLASYFGSPVSPQQYEGAVEALPGTNAGWQTLAQEAWFENAQTVAHGRCFFHWELEFPEVFFDGKGLKRARQRGFSAVLGNPPYVNVTNIDADLRMYLLARFDTAVGRFDLYITFTERAISLLQEGGMFGFIQPIKFTIYAHGKPLRELLLDHTQIQQIVNISQCRVFPDPTTYPCIPVVRKCAPSSGHRLTALHVHPDMPESIVVPGATLRAVHEIPQSRFRHTPERVISLRLTDELWDLVGRIGATSLTLGSDFDIEQCIRIGSAAKRRKLVLDDVRYSEASQQVRATCKKVLDGENIEKYAIHWAGDWLHYLPEELYNPKSREVLETERILVKRIAPSLTAVADLGADGDYYYPLNTIYALIPRRELKYSLQYVSALLNSSLFDWYYKLLFEAIAVRGGYIEYREYLKFLPVRRISFNTQPARRKQMVETGMQLYKRHLTDAHQARIPRLAEDMLEQRLERADVVHDLLAFLADQMIDMNKEKQTETKGFLTWLQRRIGAKVDDLSNKTKVKDYHEHDLDALLDVLKKNRRKLKVNPDTRAVQEALGAECGKSMAKLEPLKAKIAATARLIDLIVYRLYGLTEDEIRIVEGEPNAAATD